MAFEPNLQRNESPKNHNDEAKIASFLSGHHWPKNLQIEFLKRYRTSAVRYFICDDCRSLVKQDAQMFSYSSSRRKDKMEECPRWDEMGNFLLYNLKLSRLLKANTEFLFLSHREHIKVGSSQDQNDKALAFLHSILSKGPSKNQRVTISTGIRKVISQIKSVEESLRAKNQKVTIIIVTDGEKIQTDLGDTIEILQHLPVNVVVRLCSQNEVVSDYFVKLDASVNMRIDVISEFRKEAKKISRFNDWLIYGEPLQRCREFGIYIDEFDSLNEHALSLEEVKVVCSILYGDSVSTQPEINTFQLVLSLIKHNSNLGKIFCPRSKKLKHWVNPAKVLIYYGFMTLLCYYRRNRN